MSSTWFFASRSLLQKLKPLVVLSAFACLLLAMFVPAEAGPAYRRLVTNNAANQSWRDGLVLSIHMDEQACKKAYGNNWFYQCQAPVPGKVGQRVDSVRMTPRAEGVWRWISDTELKFFPKTHLAANTLYTISLEQVTLPQRYTLNKNILYRTPPQAVHLEKETLWIDPSAKGQHVLSLPMKLIWPYDTAQFEKMVRLTPPTGERKLRFGPMRFVWNDAHDEVVVNVPILSLPEKNCTCLMSVQGLPGWHYERGNRVFDAQSKGKTPQTQVSFAITGTDRLMDVKSIVIEPVYDNNLSREYQLVVTTSLQTKPADVLSKLDLLLLPKKAAAGQSQDCNWSLMPALSAEDIQNSTKITPILLQPGDEAATEIRLRLPGVEEKRGVMCAMKTGLRSLAGHTLNRVKRFVLTAPSMRAEVNFLQPGNVLPLRNGQKIDIHSVGVDRLEWEVSEVRDPFLALAAARTGFKKDEDDDNEIDFAVMSQVRKGSVAIPEHAQGQASFTALDLAELEGGNAKSSLMRLTLKGFAGKASEPVSTATRLILVSDLGLMLKTQADGTHVAFVRRISTGEPVDNAEIRLLGANGLPCVAAQTSKDGRAALPSTYGLNREKKPTALVCVKDAEFGWLSLDDYAAVVEFSDFPVNGRHVSEQGLMASVFTERGVYMPGETLHFGAILRNQAWQPLGEKLPVIAVLYGPAGNKLLQQTLVLGAEGLGSLDYTTEPDCPAGLYRLDICLAKGKNEHTVLGSVTTRVEEFQPDTLALSLNFAGDNPKGWIRTQDKARVQVVLKNLYGEPAVGNRVRARFLSEPRKLNFSAYKDFTFCDKESAGENHEVSLPEFVTDEKGQVLVDLPLESLGLGTQFGTLLVEGFEKSGGRAVSRSLTHVFSPRSSVLGYKPEDGANNLNYLPEGSKAALRLLLLNANLDPVQGEAVRLTLSARRFVTSLVSDSAGNYRYDATPADTELSSQDLTLEAKGTQYVLPTDHAGEFLLTVRNAKGEELGQIPFTVAGTRLAAPGQEPVLANGSLRLTLDKEHYAPGETIHFQMSAPFAGTGLVSLERDQVVAHAWFTAKAGESVHEITIPRDFEGRGYLNVSFVRDVDSPAIYMNPHVYGVVPFTSGITTRDMGISIAAPATVAPGDEVKIKLSAKKAGQVQLFLVDEGVLQLTDFAVPDPLRDLLTDRALDVVTRQAFHLLMPDHERLRGRIPGFGGGMGNGGGRFLNPFRRKSEPPFAYWAPLQSVGPDGCEIQVKVPEYFNGAFRIMAVGSSLQNGQLAAGSAKARAEVRGNLILKPQLPLVVTPGDTFEGALVIANTVKGSGDKAEVSVHLDLPEALRLVQGKTDLTLLVPENGERVVPIRLAVQDDLGENSIRFSAKLKNAKTPVVRSQSLSVRPAAQRTLSETAFSFGELTEEGGSVLVPSERDLYPYEAKSRITVADAPLLALRALLDRLDSYPYGCTEQKISKAMPYVVLFDAPALRKLVLSNPKRSLQEQQKFGEKTIAEAIAAIWASLQYDGISVWPGPHSSSSFVTAYAADFLVSMHEHGLQTPGDLAERILNILESNVSRTPESVDDGRLKIYEAWILQRDGRIMTSALSSLEEWFKQNTNGWETDVLSSLLADSFVTLRLKKRAQARLPQGQVNTTSDPFFSTAMSRALHALVLLRTFGMGEEKAQIIDLVKDAAFSENATTIDLAMSSRALVELARQKNNAFSEMSANCQEYAKGFGGQENNARFEGLLVFDAPGCRRFAISKPAEASSLSVLLTEDGFDRKPVSAKGKLEVTKTLRDDHDQPVKAISLGDVVTAKICVRSPGKPVHDAVIVDLVPGGLEPILEKGDGPSAEGLLRYERREDRGLFFVSLVPEERCFSYRLRAATKGRFVAPAADASAMYEPALNGTSQSGVIEVQ
ncbi:MAG: hypothetical protein K6G15_04430 [Desulfovibrio sp.]|nr:hypothetical protein [Desulfovibrio sp.]